MNVNFTGVCMNVKICYDLFPDESSFEVLRNVDHEVAHLFVGVDDVDEINACLIVVIPNPVITPLKGFDVMADKKPLNLSPAAFCNPELIRFIPKRNIPNAPNSVNICNMPIKIILVFYCKITSKMFQKCYKKIRLQLNRHDKILHFY